MLYLQFALIYFKMLREKYSKKLFLTNMIKKDNDSLFLLIV